MTSVTNNVIKLVTTCTYVVTGSAGIIILVGIETANPGGESMNIIGKYIIKNITEKKLRTVLIILSIAVSSALYFASSSISDTMVKVQTERWRASVGYTDITVQAWYESPSRYFSKDNIKGLEDNFQYAVGSLSGYGLYKYANDQKQGVNLWGIDFNELNKITNVDLISSSNIYPFGGMKIIISRFTANKHNLYVGDSIPLDINGSRHKLLICGIAESNGPFIGEGDTVLGIVPPDTLRSLYNVRGKVDTLYLKLKNPGNKQQMILELKERYKRYNVREPFTEKEIRSHNNKIRIPFLALTIILSFMSIYIINSTFKVITLERLPAVGTFRSLGAERKTTNRMLIAESLLYGSGGGIAGCLIGIGVLYLMSIFTMPTWDEGYRAAIAFKPIQLVYTFIMSVMLCLISSVMPIIGINRIPIKEVILNTAQGFKRNKAFRGIAGFMLIAFGILSPLLVRGKYSVYINALCIVAVIAAVVMVIPFITAGFIKISGRAYSALFGNEGIIAVKNIKGNRSINGSIALLAIGISCLLFVNTLSYSTLKELLNLYDRKTYEIYMSAKNADKNFIQAVKSTDGVKDAYKSMDIGGIEVVNKSDVIGLTQGIETERFLEYNNLQLPGDRQKIIDMLDMGRRILVANSLRDRLELKLGDEMTLRAWGNQSSYRVVGFFESIENSGNYAIISSKYMKLDIGWSDDFYSTLYIKTDGDPDKVAQNLKARFARQQPNIKTMKEMKNENLRYNEQIFSIAKGFSVMTMLAGILGIFNNLIINFIQRRRHLAMYRSVGMSKSQIVKMIFIEALTTGIIGSFTGVVCGMIMILSGAGLLKSLEMEMNIHYSGMELALCLVFGIIIAITASIGPALKSSRLNLMEVIKYE